ncbi:hypothetical protein DP46_947 [Burkholderia pseudomallei]|nr:hypothetical protein DP46_947 [Burkholderia pseudomallei]
MAVHPSPAILLGPGLSSPPLTISSVLLLRQSAGVKQPTQYDLGTDAPLTPQWLEPLVVLSNLSRAAQIIHPGQERRRHKQVTGKSVRVPLVTSVGLHVMLIVDRTAPMQQ